MGLILFAAGHPDWGETDAGPLTDDDEAAFAQKGLEGSLSARWCIGIVLDATDVSLTEGWEEGEDTWIPPDRVRAMAADLEAADRERLALDWDEDPRRVDELARWFRICADRGLGIDAL